MNRTYRVFKLGCAALFACLALVAQDTGGLRGRVLDPSGAAIPKASVVVSGPNSTVKVVETDTTGTYSVLNLPPGAYTVRVNSAGFGLIDRWAR